MADLFSVSVSVLPSHAFQQSQVQPCLLPPYERGRRALLRAFGSITSFSLRQHGVALVTSHFFWRYGGQQVGYHIDLQSLYLIGVCG